jgi:hypothetical protein
MLRYPYRDILHIRAIGFTSFGERHDAVRLEIDAERPVLERRKVQDLELFRVVFFPKLISNSLEIFFFVNYKNLKMSIFKNKIYVNVKLSGIDFLGFRMGGDGLGNIMFPWARGIVFARKHNFQKINSSWKTFKFGTFLRGERDKRTYHNIFEEKNVGGLQKFLCLFFIKKINESDFYKNSNCTSKHLTVTFEGMKNQMADIVDDYEIVREELLKIIRPKHLNLAKKNSTKYIAVHVRLGDFYEPENESQIRNGMYNCRLPIEWYITIINKIRLKYGEDIPVSVFSDGKDNELISLLKLPNVTRVIDGSGISDMISLSMSGILIASNSTFSLWSSYLGRIPTIWFPGTFRINLFKKEENIFEGEIDYDNELPEGLLN